MPAKIDDAIVVTRSNEALLTEIVQQQLACFDSTLADESPDGRKADEAAQVATLVKREVTRVVRARETKSCQRVRNLGRRDAHASQ